MANNYGFITTESDAAKVLMDLNKNWEQSYKNISESAALESSTVNAQAKLANEAALSDYQSALAQAYKSASEQRAMIGSSALGTGYKDALRAENKAALAEAYNTYSNKLVERQSEIDTSQAEALNTISENAYTATQNVTSALQSEAQNVIAYDKAHYDYLSNLFDQYKDNLMDSPFALNPFDVTQLGYSRSAGVAEKYGVDFSKFVKYVDGELQLKSQEEINQMLANDPKLYEEYYDAIENWAANRGDSNIESWGSYLNRTNADLYNWAASQNAYQDTDTGASLFRQATGRDATDESYSFSERFGGMNNEEIKQYIKTAALGITGTLDQLSSDVTKGSNKSRAKKIVEAYDDVDKSLRDIAKSLGIDDSELQTIYNANDLSALDTRNAFQRFTTDVKKGSQAAIKLALSELDYTDEERNRINELNAKIKQYQEKGYKMDSEYIKPLSNEINTISRAAQLRTRKSLKKNDSINYIGQSSASKSEKVAYAKELRKKYDAAVDQMIYLAQSKANK